MTISAPKAQGLYDPRFEHDACGIGAVVNISGRREHAIVEHGKQVLLNLMHRGAAGADESTGDGAGILFQIPHEFFAAEAGRLGFTLPEPRALRRRPCSSCPQDGPGPRRAASRSSRRRSPQDGLEVARLARRAHRQRAAWARSPGRPSRSSGSLHRRPRAARTRTWSGGCTWSASGRSIASRDGSSARRPAEFYVPSMSCRTIVYKGMFLAPQLFAYYPDLADQRVADRPGHRPPALQHQHVPELAAGPAVPHDRPQRRDQHAARQRQPAAGHEKTMACPAAGRGPVRAVSDRRAGRQRLGLLRQRAGAAGPRRPLRPARPDDDDPRGVRPAVSHQHRQAGVLRVPRGDHGAVGRPGGDGLHRRPAGRRHAGPQRAAAVPVRGDHRRAGGAGQRGRA